MLDVFTNKTFNEISDFTFDYAMSIETPESKEWCALNMLFNNAIIKRNNTMINYLNINKLGDFIPNIRNYIYDITDDQINQLFEILPMDQRKWFIDTMEQIRNQTLEVCTSDDNMFPMIVRNIVSTFININPEDLIIN